MSQQPDPLERSPLRPYVREKYFLHRIAESNIFPIFVVRLKQTNNGRTDQMKTLNPKKVQVLRILVKGVNAECKEYRSFVVRKGSAIRDLIHTAVGELRAINEPDKAIGADIRKAIMEPLTIAGFKDPRSLISEYLLEAGIRARAERSNKGKPAKGEGEGEGEGEGDDAPKPGKMKAPAPVEDPKAAAIVTHLESILRALELLTPTERDVVAKALDRLNARACGADQIGELSSNFVASLDLDAKAAALEDMATRTAAKVGRKAKA
jgi:hypothetical protein